MTISSLIHRNDYVGSGTTGPFAFAFRIFAATDLAVIRRNAAGTETTLTYLVDYTLSTAAVGNRAGGTVTLTTALAADGSTLTLLRSMSLLQPTELRNQGAYYPETIEDGFDRLVMIDQTQQDAIDRSLRLLASIPPAGRSLGLNPSVAGQAIVADGAGGFTMATLSTGATALPGAGRTVTTLAAYLVDNAVFNVLDYANGLAPNGTNDMTGAIVAADAAAAALNNGGLAGGADVLFPPGRYKTTAALTPSPGVRWRGSGSIPKWNGTGGPQAIYPTRIEPAIAAPLIANATAGLLVKPASGASVHAYAMENLHWDGTNCTGFVDGLLIDVSTGLGATFTNSYFSHCTFSNFPQSQIHEKDGGLGAVWGIEFDHIGAHNKDRTVTGDIVWWEGSANNTIEIFWTQPLLSPYTAGKWALRSPSGAHTLFGGTINPSASGSGAGVGAHGIFVGGYLHVHGTHFENINNTQTDVIGIRVVGSGGHHLSPSHMSGFAKNIQIGDPTNPSSVALGTMISGSVGGFAAGAGNCDIHIVAGGQRGGTIILSTGSPNSGPTVIDDRATTDAIYEVMQFINNRIILPAGAIATPALQFAAYANSGLSIDLATGDVVLSLAAVEGMRVTAAHRLQMARQLFPGSFTTDDTKQLVAGLLAGTGAPTNGVGANGDFGFRADRVAGPVLYRREGGTWVPVLSLGSSADNGDASVTITRVSAPTQRFDTALTANRTLTLPANGSSLNGDTFRVVRTGLGAFTLTVQDAGAVSLKAIPGATAAFVDVEFNGTAWKLSGYGTL